jgi:hypothetical protein
MRVNITGLPEGTSPERVQHWLREYYGEYCTTVEDAQSITVESFEPTLQEKIDRWVGMLNAGQSDLPVPHLEVLRECVAEAWRNAEQGLAGGRAEVDVAADIVRHLTDMYVGVVSHASEEELRAAREAAWTEGYEAGEGDNDGFHHGHADKTVNPYLAVKQWVVSGQSMVVEAASEQEAIDRAQEMSGWSWEAEEQS